MDIKACVRCQQPLSTSGAHWSNTDFSGAEIYLCDDCAEQVISDAWGAKE